ncbi:Arginine biosynthesis bifunctional protein ArgJ [Nymphon striatum]|nr:Arginine biosynthesis bifunctional protein ArgJ [Nymphon striatum]
MSKFKLPASSRNIVLAVAISCAAIIPSFAQETKETVIARVNGVELTDRELALAEVDLLEQFAKAPADQRRAMILNALLDIKVLALAAEEAGLADEANFKAQMSFNRARALHNNYFQSNALNVITEEDLQKRYDIEVKSIPVQPEVRARHILVEKEEDAKAIIAELDGGADFIELAKAKSTGPSGPQGGDLGYFGRGQMFGYHIIFKEDQRDSQPPSFEQVKGQIRQALAREKYFLLTQGARAKFEVEILDEDLKAKLDALQSQICASWYLTNRQKLPVFLRNPNARQRRLIGAESIYQKARPKAIVINSGNANAFTGQKGIESTAQTAKAAAGVLNCSEKSIFLASTGLSMLLVRDGEGATKQVCIEVTGAKNKSSARKIAKAIANSPLVKTAIAGEDANWGRIVMAVGKAGEPAERDLLTISFGDVTVAANW